MTLVRSFFSKKRRVMCGSTRKLSNRILIYRIKNACISELVFGWVLCAS